MENKYKTVHTIVFQAAEGGGNPCPVTLHADGLTTEDMQKMTKEFGFESVYLMTPTRSDCDIKARYFVPLHEMEMCIHATIGSAVVLVTEGIFTKSPIIYETSFGPVQVDWQQDDEDVTVSVHQFLPQYASKNPMAAEVAEALCIPEADVAVKIGPIESAATSRKKLIVPLKSREILDNLQPDFEKLWALCDDYETTGFYPFALEKDDNNQPVFYARQFPKRAGYPEDPATGVASSALSVYLAKHEIIPVHEGWNSYTIMQGFAMGRPSVLYPEVYVENGQITATRVRGKALIVK